MKLFQKTIILASLLMIVVSSLITNPTEVNADPAPSVMQCLYKHDCVGLLQDTEILVYRMNRAGILVPMSAISSIGNGGGRLSYSEGWSMVTRDGFLDNVFMNHLGGTTCQPWLEDTSCASPGEGVAWLHPSDPNEDRAFFTCPTNQNIAHVDLATCQAIHYGTSFHTGPSSITIGNDRAYALNSSNATVWNWSPLHTNGGFAFTFESSGTKIRFWDDGSDGVLFMNSGDAVLAKFLPLQDGAPNAFYTLPVGWGEGDMDVNATHLVQARANGNDAALMDITTNIATPSSSATTLAINGARHVAITAKYVYAEEMNGPAVVTQVFDLSGNPVATINEWSNDVASFWPIASEGCTNSATSIAEPSEACDGSDFDGITCQNYGFDGGELSCSAACDQIFTSNCWSCGDGEVNPPLEQCDGSDLAGATCADQSYANGTVSCTSSCIVDYSACYTCGNAVIEGPEQCEGADIQGNDCTTIGLGFMGGNLTCDAGTCSWDTSQCHKCGNNVTDLGETCDGTHVPSDVCETLGYDGGTLGCNSTCDGYDDTNCSYCGDGQLDDNELCDLDQFQAGTACSDSGFGTGTVTCFEDCTMNYFACSAPPTTGCGNGVVDTGEECDDGNHANDDSCSDNCKIISITCGDLVVDAPEEDCDDPDYSAMCVDLGLGTEGVAFCEESCFLNTSYCSFESMQKISLQIDVDPEPEDDLSAESLLNIAELKTAGYTRNCNGVQSVQDGWLIDGVAENCYCTARVVVKGTSKRGFFVFHTPKENALGDRQPAFRVYPDGTTRAEYGAWINKWNGLPFQMVVALEDGPRLLLTPALKAEKTIRFKSSNSEGVAGAYLGFKVNGGQFGIRLPEMTTEQAIMVPKMMDSVDIPLDRTQLEAWFSSYEPTTVDPPKKKGCSTAGSPLNNPLPTFIVISMLLMLAYRRRRK